jgi:arginine repressor
LRAGRSISASRYRYLDRYRDEIIRLYRDQRKTQAQIRRHLEETYNIDVPKTTLSNFIQELRAAGLLGTAQEPSITPEEEQFLAQYEVFQKLEQSSAQVLDAAAQILARMVVLEEAARERHEAILAAITRPGVAASPPRELAGPTPPISWPRAFLLIGLLLAFIVVLGVLVWR